GYIVRERVDILLADDGDGRVVPVLERGRHEADFFGPVIFFLRLFRRFLRGLTGDLLATRLGYLGLLRVGVLFGHLFKVFHGLFLFVQFVGAQVATAILGLGCQLRIGIIVDNTGVGFL